mmetsp:Transcript_57003/g.123384  ORF Transcript_57003/g.123384 Transcript_57003/m.123384 type:complete len:110 (+) Transcript_57003:221-550(+)
MCRSGSSICTGPLSTHLRQIPRSFTRSTMAGNPCGRPWRATKGRTNAWSDVLETRIEKFVLEEIHFKFDRDMVRRQADAIEDRGSVAEEGDKATSTSSDGQLVYRGFVI